MPIHPIDSMHQHALWAQGLWDMIAEGGVWGVPRCGLMFRKQQGKLVLTERMPWEEGMPLTAEDLREAQDWDVKGITETFAGIGVEVVDATTP